MVLVGDETSIGGKLVEEVVEIVPIVINTDTNTVVASWEKKRENEGRGWLGWRWRWRWRWISIRVEKPKAMERACYWSAGTRYSLYAGSSCLFARPSQWLSPCASGYFLLCFCFAQSNFFIFFFSI